MPKIQPAEVSQMRRRVEAEDLSALLISFLSRIREQIWHGWASFRVPIRGSETFGMRCLFFILVGLFAGCGRDNKSEVDRAKRESELEPMVKYATVAAGIGRRLFEISLSQYRQYTYKLDAGHKYASYSGMTVPSLLELNWNRDKDRDWAKFGTEVLTNLTAIRAEIGTNLPSPPKGCEMVSQQLESLLRVSNTWQTLYTDPPVGWLYWEHGVTTRYKEAKFEFDKLEAELLRDIVSPVKEAFEGTFTQQTSVMGIIVETALDFRNTGVVIERGNALSTYPYSGLEFGLYSVTGDMVTIRWSDGSRVGLKKDGRDLLSVESYSRSGKKEGDHRMERFLRR